MQPSSNISSWDVIEGGRPTPPRAGRRGVTTIQIGIGLIVVGVGTVVGLVASKRGIHWNPSKGAVARHETRSYLMVAEKYVVDHPGVCPTPEQLREAREIPSASNIEDPWGKPYLVRCRGNEVVVLSYGLDGKEGTKDDVIAPQASEQP